MAKNRIQTWLHLPSLETKKDLASTLRAPLHLESLEDRIVPAVPANEVYVSSLYQGFLGRAAEPAGLAAWVSLLNAGENRVQVALGIERSDEFTGRAVQIYYQDFLGRTADIGGLNSWVEAVRQGSTLEDVEALILGSDEFYNDNGGTMDSFLNAVYKAELGRSVDPTGLAYWPTVTVNNPVGRATTVARIMRSTEGEQDEITSIYQLPLGRLPDSAGLASWTAALQQGEGDLNVIARIVGSNEYFDDLQAFAATGSDPNAAAHEFIVSTDRFSASLPGAEEFNATIATNPSLVRPPFPQPPIPFIPLCGSTAFGFGTGPTIGPTGGGGGTTGGTGGTGGGTGSFGGSGGTGGSGGSGGGSGSLRAAAPENGHANGGMRGVGGRGQGGGMYMGGGLLSHAGLTHSGPHADAGAGARHGDALATARAELRNVRGPTPPTIRFARRVDRPST